MIKAVLLDLDNTLLRNPDAVFAPQYLTLAEAFFADYWKMDGLSQALLKIVRHTAGVRDMQMTNTELATAIINETTGKTPSEIEDGFSRFYVTTYPQLRTCTEAFEIAPVLVKSLQQQGVAVVIATNPIYPAEAIRQRLGWAGISDNFKDYALVTHADNMHFVKPDPAFYAEIVARVGIEPDEAIMAGDSLRNDVHPALKVGLHAYHINDETGTSNTMTGTLEQFYRLVQEPDWLDSFPADPLKPAMIEPELRGNVGALFGMLQDAKPHFWTQHPDPEEWSPIQVICHLLESEGSVQRPRLERIRAEDNPFIAAPKQPPGPKEAVVCEDDGWVAARRFAEERVKTIQWLRELRPEEWSRPARHSIFGPTSLLEMAHFTAQHDRLHLNQLCRTLGQCE